MPSSRAVPLLLLALPLAGCPLFFDPGSVALRDGGDMADDAADDMPLDGDQPRDVAIDVDLDASDASDVGSDVSDMQADARDMRVTDTPPDISLDVGPNGEPCPGPHPELGGSCMLVTQNPCDPDTICEVVLVDGMPSRECRQRPAGDTYDLAEGEPCDPGSTQNCEPHLFCRSGFCVRYCDLEDGFGCEPGQFCAPHEPGGLFAGLGYCTATCP